MAGICNPRPPLASRVDQIYYPVRVNATTGFTRSKCHRELSRLKGGRLALEVLARAFVVRTR